LTAGGAGWAPWQAEMRTAAKAMAAIARGNFTSA
jgi:hypothetical protein